MVGYMEDWTFEQGSDGSEQVTSFALTSNYYKYGSRCLVYQPTGAQLDVMTRDDVTDTTGQVRLWMYLQAISSGSILGGPCGMLEWDATNYEDAVGACIYKTSSNTYFQLGRMSSDGTAFNATTSNDVSSSTSDDTWYFITLDFEESAGDIICEANLYSSESPTATAIDTINHTYNDAATSGDQVGVLFLGSSNNIYVDNFSFLYDA